MSASTHTMPSQADAILARLEETPNEWVPMPELVRISKAYAVHSRIAELRTKRGKIIAHKNVSIPGSRQLASYYKLTPDFRLEPENAELRDRHESATSNPNQPY